MTTLRERTLLNSSKIIGKPFIGDTRRQRIFDKLRKSIEKDPGLEKDLDLYYDELVSSNLNENKKLRLGDIIIAKQGGDLIKILMLYPEEREVMYQYGLNIDEIKEYKNVANNILLDGDEEIFGLLDIPVNNPNKCSDCYRKVLYYIAELCKNERQIRADFFKEAVS